MKKSELRNIIKEEIRKLLNEAKKMSIVGTTKFKDVDDGIITFANDSNIVKWFKQFNEEEDEIIFDNNIAKQLQKMLGVKVEEHFNDYWDDAYSRYLWFTVSTQITGFSSLLSSPPTTEISDKEIVKKLKGKSFKVKFSAESH